MMLNKSTVVSPIGENGIFQPNSGSVQPTYEVNEHANGGNGLIQFLERYATYSVGMDDYTII